MYISLNNNKLILPIMKKILLLFLFCISAFIVNSQNFKIKDVQLIPLGVFNSNKKQDNFNNGGIHVGLALGFVIYKQNFRLQFNAGEDLNILGSNHDRFSSLNLLFEVHPKLVNWMQTEVYSGFGLHRVSYTKFPSGTINSTYFNVPLGTRLMFLSKHRLSFGFQFQAEFNHNNNTFMYSTILRYNFKHTSNK